MDEALKKEHMDNNSMSASDNSEINRNTQWKKQSQHSFDVILVDSDNSSVHERIETELREYKVLASVNFDQILTALHNHPAPSLIIVSVENDKVDPFNTLIKLKENTRTSNIPVIMISAHKSIDDLVRAYGLGCDEFVTFPMRSDEFQARITAKLKQQEKQNKIQQLVYSDELTGITNRRGYNQTLSAEWARGRRSKLPLSMILVDIDNFKTFNDTYGHLKGDTLIQFTANILSQVCSRSTDLVARYGGDEFVVLLPDCNFIDSANVAQLILDSFNKKVANAIGVIPLPEVSISVGIASQIPSASGSSMDLFNDADQALYEAKSLGKGCWRRSPEP